KTVVGDEAPEADALISRHRRLVTKHLRRERDRAKRRSELVRDDAQDPMFELIDLLDRLEAAVDADLRRELVLVEGLRDVVIGADLVRMEPLLHGGLRGHHDDLERSQAELLANATADL